MFFLNFPTLQKAINDCLKKHPDYNLVVVGHSLGASIAQLTTMYIIFVILVYFLNKIKILI